MKKVIILSSLMLLASCSGNASVTNSVEQSVPESTEVSIDESISTSIEIPAIETPDLESAIAALGDAFVIHYTNTKNGVDSNIYCTGKSVFTQFDSTSTEIALDMDEWWVVATSNLDTLSQCTFGTYGEDVWYLTYEENDYENVASNVLSLDASLFTYDSVENIFNYSADVESIKENVEMLASLNKKNDFQNLEFDSVQIKLSNDNSVIETISITAKDTHADEDVKFELTFSEYSELPYGLSDAEPIEAE